MSDALEGAAGVAALCEWPHAPDDQILLRSKLAIVTVGDLRRLRDALIAVKEWADAYPLERFDEPDLERVGDILTGAGERRQMDRMHASWARELLSGVGQIAAKALEGKG